MIDFSSKHFSMDWGFFFIRTNWILQRMDDSLYIFKGLDGFVLDFYQIGGTGNFVDGLEAWMGKVKKVIDILH